jgi:hypothetical protein
LILKCAAASRPSGEWKDDHFDVLADGVVVGRTFKTNAAPVGSPWSGRSPSASRGSHADARLRGNSRGGDGGVRQVLAAGVTARQLLGMIWSRFLARS